MMSCLILCVSLSQLWDAHKAGKILFLGVSMRMFVEEFSICIRLSKEDPPPPILGNIVQLFESLNRTKMWRKRIVFLLVLEHPF